VAILTGVAAWSIGHVNTESQPSRKSEVASASPAAKAYVDGVVALSPGQRAAIYGNVAPLEPSVRSVNAQSPELQSVDVSSTPYVGSLNASNFEPRAGVHQAADLAAIADWARAEGLTGLSPTSLRPSAAPDAAIADWARAEGLTGLSPASLKPSAASNAEAIAALPQDQLVAMFGNVG
jgi:hypothetical protein